MKIRGLIVAASVLAVLGGLLYWSEHRKPEESPKVSADTPPAILKLDDSTITNLEIKKKDAEPILLAKSGSGNWQITEPKPLNADQSAVSSMVSTLSSLNSERLVDEKATDLKRYGLDQPSVEVDLGEKNKKTQKLLIGDDTPTGSAAYAKLDGDPRVFTMASFNKTAIDKSLNDLRDKRLLTIDSDKVSRIELTRKNQTIEFGRNKNDWQILKPRPLRADSSQVADLARKLADAKMDLTTDSKETASLFAQGNPVATAKVTDQSGTQELQVRKNQVRKNKDAFYAKSSVVDGAYKIGSDIGESLGKGVDDFRNKKIFDFGYNDPNKLEIHDGQKTYFLTRSGEDWWSNGKKMDETTVQSLVSKLREMTAGKFVDSGFNNPGLTATVVSDDGKRVEKVLIAKSGKDYIAKRENEPSLYQLDSSTVEDIEKAAGEIKPAPAEKK